MADEATRKAFGEALQKELTDQGRSHPWLANRVGVTPSQVSRWTTGKDTPPPDKVAKMEQALGTKGRLGRILSYDTAGPKTIRSVVEAIQADTKLSDGDRAILIAAYRAAVARRR